VGGGVVVVRVGDACQAKERTTRRRSLARTAIGLGSGHIVLGQQASDLAETLRMRLQRAATGLKGLTGFRENARFPAWPQGLGLTAHRPLIKDTRVAIRQWVNEEGLAVVADPANENPNYLRVRARALINPVLEAKLIASANRAHAIDRYWCERAMTIWDQTLTGRWEDLLTHPPPLRRRLLKGLIAVHSGQVQTISEANLDDLAETLRSKRVRFTALGALWDTTRPSLSVTTDPGLLHGRRDGTQLRPKLVKTRLGVVQGGRLLRLAKGGKRSLQREILAHVL